MPAYREAHLCPSPRRAGGRAVRACGAPWIQLNAWRSSYVGALREMQKSMMMTPQLSTRRDSSTNKTDNRVPFAAPSGPVGMFQLPPSVTDARTALRLSQLRETPNTPSWFRSVSRPFNSTPMLRK